MKRGFKKICTKCGVEKLLRDYYKRPDTMDKHQAICKECNKAANRERNEKHPGMSTERVKKWRKDYGKTNIETT